MKWKDFVSDYFSFTRKERLGVMLMLMVVLAAVFLPFLFKGSNAGSITVADSSLLLAISTLKSEREPLRGTSDKPGDQLSDRYNHLPIRDDSHPRDGELFPFDPNTISFADWQRLGLSNKTIATIQKYISKGGRFKKAEDLGKIYSLPHKTYERLAPFVRIVTEEKLYNKRNGEYTRPLSNNPARPNKWPALEPLDINTADTTAFIRLPGIGIKLATRIVSFRSKLGGFYKVEQVAETFGLPDSTFQKIRPYLAMGTMDVRKLNINTASLEELKSHPYIRHEIASTIVLYRNAHGPYASLEDLKKVMVVTEDILKKISPYLEAK